MAPGVRHPDLSSFRGRRGDAQAIIEPGVAAFIVTFALLQRLILTDVLTRYQVAGLGMSVAAIELLVMPLLGRRPSGLSFLANLALAALAMAAAKWALEGINWSSALRHLLRLTPSL